MNYIDKLKIKDGLGQRVSYSSLSKFAKSPIDYLRYVNKDYETTEAMIIGSATDCLLLEPEEFDNRFMVIENVKRNTKVGKEKYAEYCELAKKKELELIKEQDFERISMMVNSVKSNPNAKWLLDNTTSIQHRIKFEYENPETEYNHKFTINGITDGIGENPITKTPFIFDLKTTNDCNKNIWSTTVIKWYYHLQAYIYYKGIQIEEFRRRSKLMKPEFYHIVVENKEPFKVYVFKFDENFMAEGKKLFEQIMVEFEYCKEHNLWTQGTEFHEPEMVTLELPNWYKNK